METRGGDLVLPQGTYVHLQDGATGQVDVVTGPHKVSLADTDKPVVYESDSRRFAPTVAERAIRVCPAADEGQYIVLTNPTKNDQGDAHPKKGKEPAKELVSGRKINIQGPDTFALFPGQIADVIPGHQLKSNEYLVIRIYNEEEAKANFKKAVVKTAEGDNKTKLFDEKEIRTGNLLVIKGTDVSFYIPPTGIEVIEEGKAVTLERLEYCILLDQNGDKRYLKGPDVVFPKPTETFIEDNKGKRVFRAIELNENMGLYIKVIADYEEKNGNGFLKNKSSNTFKAGEELFITGKEQKIYFPRAEHAIIKYGNETIHYATAVPKGEGRYLLDKNTGEVKLVKGPKMLLPDPRIEVIVKRVLDERTVNLWFPGNIEALLYNTKMLKELRESDSDFDFIEEEFSGKRFATKSAKTTVLASAAAPMIADEMTRKSVYTKPRTISLDTKYDGAVLMNIWSNHAVQVVDKTGNRRVVEGPQVIMLEYDESLDVLELSTGKPKNDEKLMKTVYLQTNHNSVSDVVTVETKDLINVDVLISYKVNFEGTAEGDIAKWFGVSDYVKLLTQHMRSLIRNVAKKKTIEEFNENATDIIRDAVLGESGKRTGRKFDENGMKIYDVEVLNLKIELETIDTLLRKNQHTIVKQNLESAQMQKDLEFQQKAEKISRDKMSEAELTLDKQKDLDLKKIGNQNEINSTKLKAEEAQQEILNKINIEELLRDQAIEKQHIDFEKQRSDIKITEVEREMKAIQPKLIEAIISSNDVKLTEILAKNLKEQRNGSSFFELFAGKSGGFEGLLETVKGSSLENRVRKLMKDYNEQYKKEPVKK